MKKVRTRYAPSPTGYLHIGGARTALFCYVFAKHHQGDFIFRLEDTDVARNVPNGEKSQLENLAWLGIIPDESPLIPNPKYGKYRQSEKLERYQEIIQEMVDQGLAYIAYDLPEELDEQRKEQEQRGISSFRYDRNWLKISEEEIEKRLQEHKYSIRVALPKNKMYSWNDLVRGEIAVNSDEIGDWVIQKSDGYPTYNFAVVVDDHDMAISHVLRGEEHITNTPKQLIIYDLLKWEPPQFGHLTIITNMEGKKLSKRDTSLSQFIEDYKNEKYVAEAIFNFLALLGWTAEDGKEMMRPKELIKKFDYRRLSKSPSKFDLNKMNWFGKQYLKKQLNKEIMKQIVFPDGYSQKWKDIFVEIYKQNCINVKQMEEQLEFFGKELEPIDLDQVDQVVIIFIEQMKENEFSIEGIQKAIDGTKEISKKSGKNLFLPIRQAATGLDHGPELAKSIYLFGQDKIYKRLGIK